MALKLRNNPRSTIQGFKTHLHRWFRKEQRPLPWRTEASVYRTVVSEFMCQQTQIATAIPYFERWMRSFPDFEALARASEEDVLKHWEGLGYYRRARYLQAIARILEDEPPPRTPAGWTELPGVGPYTAAAISSLAFGRAAACVDGNVVRILNRLTGDETPFPNSAAAVKHFTGLAEVLMDDDNPGIHNQAMMELGATVCLRKKPLCMLCPVRSFCKAGPGGYADRLPRIERPKTIKQSVNRFWLVHGGKVLLHRLPDKSRRMARLHELPSLDGFSPTEGWPCLKRVRSITRYRITELIWFPPASVSRKLAKTSSRECIWVPLADIETITLSGPHRRWVREILTQGPPAV